MKIVPKQLSALWQRLRSRRVAPLGVAGTQANEPGLLENTLPLAALPKPVTALWSSLRTGLPLTGGLSVASSAANRSLGEEPWSPKVRHLLHEALQRLPRFSLFRAAQSRLQVWERATSPSSPKAPSPSEEERRDQSQVVRRPAQESAPIESSLRPARPGKPAASPAPAVPGSSEEKKRILDAESRIEREGSADAPRTPRARRPSTLPPALSRSEAPSSPTVLVSPSAGKLNEGDAKKSSSDPMRVPRARASGSENSAQAASGKEKASAKSAKSKTKAGKKVKAARRSTSSSQPTTPPSTRSKN